MVGTNHEERSLRARTYFGLVFAWTWGLQLPAVWARLTQPAETANALLPLAMLGILGPAVAALWLTRRQQGAAEARRLSRTLIQTAAPWQAYAVALLPAVLLTLGLSAMRPVGYEGSLTYVPPLSRLLVGLFIGFVEELGWRGYALPRLQQRYGALGASGILGGIWTVWHIPMFMGQGLPLDLMPVFFLQLVGGSIVFTWIYQRAGGRLFPVVIAHFVAHLNNPSLALPGDTVPLLVQSVTVTALGLALVKLDKQVFPDAHRRPRLAA